MIDTSRNNWTMAFQVFFYVRRIMLVVSAIFLREYQTVQLYMFLLAALIAIVVLGLA